MPKIRQVEIKSCRLETYSSKICVPLPAQNLPELLSVAQKLKELTPDLIEWRADYFSASDPKEIIAALEKLRAVIGDLPLIFTYRDYAEGGFVNLNLELRAAIIESVLKTGLIDLVDLEWQTKVQVREQLLQVARENKVSVILSYHDFQQTPANESIINILKAQQEAGADLAKIAVMPQQRYDVLRFMETVLYFNTHYAEIPVVAISMSPLGMISRMAGSLFGSAITFAVYGKESAPGQIPIEKLRPLLNLMSSP
ncbi:MAG: type I 3-dehydroquinate dehydratase [Firmicutes bacterium]|nr:type I 3-dehydroquinate dehydratase [Bacillota bacterium]